VVAGLSYALSHIAFVATHLVFVYWLFFMANDPLQLGIRTLDVKVVAPADKCVQVDWNAVVNNLLWFGLWCGQHFLMSRKFYKQATGLWGSPLERPIFATAAWICWFLQIYTWQPITDCTTFNVFEVPLWHWILSGIICALAAVFIVSLLWTLPEHVFGTDRYKYAHGQYPQGTLITWFPYGLVRHPAAAGFLWLYWFFPSYTPNHIYLATLWTIFILVGTLLNEEGGLVGQDEFGQRYLKYQKEVSAFYPNLACIKRFFGLAPPLKID